MSTRIVPSLPEVLRFESRAEWRSWLEENHAVASEARVAILKKHLGPPPLTIEEVQEEALCFGWIDTTGRRLDDSTFMLRIVPRRPNSEWSMINVLRVEKLAAQGLMTEAGWRSVEEAKRNGQWDLALRVERDDVIPPMLDAALRGLPGGHDRYLALPRTRRKQMLRSILSAKAEATRGRRIAAIVKELSGSGA
ncbi:MAG: YdeI/OmpD-associated family protein [Thermoleophilia bacterium]|nr:YdeI/OmpD-associated family protein [Thermoleophilia bacterium]